MTTRTPVTIPISTALSSGMLLNAAQPVAIEIPAAWTAATITFQVAQDTASWLDLYQDDGTEATAQAGASRYIILNLPDLSDVRYLRVRSGTTGTPVNQTAARTLTLVLESES